MTNTELLAFAAQAGGTFHEMAERQLRRRITGLRRSAIAATALLSLSLPGILCIVAAWKLMIS